jgi:hypothetical protein
MMEINHTQVSYVKLRLTPDEVDDVAIRRLLQLVAPAEFLKNVKGVPFLAHDDPDHRHGSVATIILRKATPQDLAVFDVIGTLQTKRDERRRSIHADR